MFGGELPRAELESLAERIRDRPGHFIAQERVSSYFAPVFLTGAVQSRRFVVRRYLAAFDGSPTVIR